MSDTLVHCLMLEAAFANDMQGVAVITFDAIHDIFDGTISNLLVKGNDKKNV